MLHHGRPVLIDFGFSQIGERVDGGTGSGKKDNEEETRICIVQPGRVRGEVRYVLAPDVAKFRGCQQGDQYAMGKTLYETIFGSPAPAEVASGRQTINEDAAMAENLKFRTELEGDMAGMASRFCMSLSERDVLLVVIRGLCRQDHPISFAVAEDLLAEGLLVHRS